MKTAAACCGRPGRNTPVKDAPRHLYYPQYLALRWLGLLAGLGVCAGVLGASGRGLPLGDVLLLSLLGAAARSRPVVMRPQSGDRSKIVYYLGESLSVIALLRDGPAAALAVSLLAALLTLPFHRQASLIKKPVESLETLLSTPALLWPAGNLYAMLGGHFLRTPSDAALFFQHPAAMVAPLLLVLFLSHDIVYRGYTALLIFCYRPVMVRPFLCGIMSVGYVYVESLCAALGLALWTVWGWSTLPFSLLIALTALLSARNSLKRVEARREAESDPLTGLASWRGLENFLDRQISLSGRRKRSFALLFLDVDGLKIVNDRLGHAAGDALLRLIGECCRGHTRKNDLVGRRGGDEFLLVLDGLDRGEAEAVQARLRESVAEALAGHAEFDGTAGASIGLAVYPQDAAGRDGLIACADRQMYADKRARQVGRSDLTRAAG